MVKQTVLRDSAFLGFLICIPWFWIAAFLHFPDWATKPVMIFSVVINAWLIYKFSIGNLRTGGHSKSKLAALYALT